MSVTRRYGSVSKARSAIRGRGNGNSPLRRLQPDERLLVRFLQQPNDWHEAWYHFIGKQFSWCSQTKNCRACIDDVKASKVVLANALDVKENKVIIMQMPTTLADSVLDRFEKFGDTVMDRDYELKRTGSGQNDTKYSADYEPPKKRNTARYEPYDIEEIVFGEMGDDDDSEDEPEDEAPRSSKNSSRRSSVEEDEDEDYEDDEDDEDEDEEVENPYADLDRSELKAEIKKFDPSFVFKKSQSDETLREVLTDLASEDEDEDEDEEPPAKKSRDAEDEYRPKKPTSQPTAKKRVLRRPN